MTTTSGSGNEQFLVAGSPAVLQALLEVIRADPDAEVVSGGDGITPPQRIVVTLPPGRAALLSQALGAAVQIEPDQMIVPLDGNL